MFEGEIGNKSSNIVIQRKIDEFVIKIFIIWQDIIRGWSELLIYLV